MTHSTTVSADVGFDIDGLNIGGGVESTNENSVTVSMSTEYTVPPGRQVVRTAGVAQTSQTGNVQINYGSRQDGHFIVSHHLTAVWLAESVSCSSLT